MSDTPGVLDSAASRHRLNDGWTLPRVGFGTYPMIETEAVEAITTALEVGYRLLDTAINYRNEHEVGQALRNVGLPREEVFIQTKIPGRDHDRQRAVQSVASSCEALGVEQVDLVLIHWPNPSQDRYLAAWEGLIDGRERGLVRSIGVSNFAEEHLARLIDATGVVPAVNQLELHPAFPQVEMLAVNQRLGILTQAWSPLGKGQARYQDEVVAGPAARYGRTPAQVILAWHLARGVLPLPKSAQVKRQRSNLNLDFTLTAEEVASITALGRPDGRLFDGDPDRYEEM